MAGSHCVCVCVGVGGGGCGLSSRRERERALGGKGGWRGVSVKRSCGVSVRGGLGVDDSRGWCT